MIIGQRILERMEAAGLSQAELARRVGLSQPSIFNLIHRGKKGSTKLHVIARVLNTTPAYLTGETDDPASELPDDILSTEDRDDVALLQRLSPGDREAVRRILKNMAGDDLTPAPSKGSQARPSRPAVPTLHAPRRAFSRDGESQGKAA